MEITTIKFVTFLFLASITSGCYAEGLLGYKAGGADAPISGSASDAGASNAAPSLEKCDNPLGTIAISEPQDNVTKALNQFKLGPPTPLLRLMIQQSNCFQVLERGIAMQNMMQERALASGGQMQQGQNIGKGQMVSADFIMTANVAFSQSNAGGAGAAVGGLGALFGPVGMLAGAVAGGIKNQQAQTSLIVSDARSGMQVAAAEGSVEKADFSFGAGGAGIGAYSNTAEGKIVAAALLDNYNNIVKSIRNLPSLANSKTSQASQKNAASAPQAGAYAVGEVLHPKINGVDIFAGAKKGDKSLQKLTSADEMIFLGEEKNGFLNVQTSKVTGWISSMLIKR